MTGRQERCLHSGGRRRKPAANAIKTGTQVRMRWFLFAIGLSLLAGQPAFAQIVFPQSKQAGSTVTILSDGLAEPDSRASQILSELSILLDNEGELRALTVNGYGGPSNVRDLLQLRGADLAIVNNDALAYLDLAKALPEARRKVRLIAPLFHQRVFLLARQGIETAAGLKGRKVGVPANRPSRGVTARTIFALLKIDAKLAEIQDKDFAKAAAGDLDAVLVFEQELPRLKSLGITPASYRLLAIPAAGPLAQVYQPGKLGKAAAGDWSPAGDLETVQVTTLLAAFDWNSSNGRYPAVASFTAKFFALLPQLRARDPKSGLSKTDVRKGLPGWQRFGPAEAPAAAAAPPRAPADNVPLASTEAPAATGALRLLAAARPPLTNPQAKDGGVVLSVLTGAFGGAGIPVTVQWTDNQRAMLDGLAGGKSADAGLFWQQTNCDAPHDQSASEADLCDRAVLSEPLMQAVLAVFIRLDASLSATGQEGPQKRTICIPESQSVPDGALSSIPWAKAAQVKLLRPKTLIDCLAAVDGREADALISIEPEARFAIERLKLQSLQISQRLSTVSGLHAAVAKDHPRQAEILQTINGAIAKLKAGGGYAAVIAAHLAELTGAAVKQP